MERLLKRTILVTVALAAGMAFAATSAPGTGAYAEPDVVVVGGGPTGLGAALTAALSGAKVVLVERDVRLGGATVQAHVTMPGLFQGWGGRHVVGGPCWTLVTNAVDLGGGTLPDFSDFPKRGYWRYCVTVNPYVYAALAEECLRAHGVDLRFASHPESLVRTNGAWRLTLVSDAGRRTVTAKVVVDATGNASVAALAGAERRRSAEVDRQPGSYIFTLNTAGMTFNGAALDKAHAEAVASGELLTTDYPVGWLAGWVRQGGGGVWCYVPGADNSTAEVRAETNWRGRAAMLRILRFLRRQPGLANATVTSAAAETGVRETWRIVGETVVRKDDYLSGRVWPDSVAYAFWYVDAHNRDRKKYAPEYPAEGVIPTVPLTALIPKGVQGVLVAGRTVSSDHLANGALRVQATCMAMGQAAGTAAALAAAQNCDVREISPEAIRAKLRTLGAAVPGK